MLTVGVLLKSLTGVWPFSILTVRVLLNSMTSVCPFVYFLLDFCSSVLLISLTCIWSFITLIQVSDWYLNLYYTYCRSSTHMTDWYLVLFYD